MEVMQKYANDDGAIGLEDFGRYPSDGDAVDFLATTTSATLVDELLQVSSMYPIIKPNLCANNL